MIIPDDNISYYNYCFCHLSVAMKAGKPAPHKALLLLSVIDLVETGIITSPIIELSNELILAFSKNAKLYANNIDFFKPNIGMPFYYMRSESFWELIPIIEGKCPISNTVTSFHKNYLYAQIDIELFEILNNEEYRNILRDTLIEKYLS